MAVFPYWMKGTREKDVVKASADWIKYPSHPSIVWPSKGYWFAKRVRKVGSKLITESSTDNGETWKSYTPISIRPGVYVSGGSLTSSNHSGFSGSFHVSGSAVWVSPNAAIPKVRPFAEGCDCDGCMSARHEREIEEWADRGVTWSDSGPTA